MKKCVRCNEVKSISEFSPNRKMLDGMHSYCKECATRLTLRARKEYDVPVELRFNMGKPWSKEDEEYLWEWQHLSQLELAYSLGRGRDSINAKLVKVRKERV